MLYMIEHFYDTIHSSNNKSKKVAFILFYFHNHKTKRHQNEKGIPHMYRIDLGLWFLKNFG